MKRFVTLASAVITVLVLWTMMSIDQTKPTTRAGHNDVAVGFSLSSHYGYAQHAPTCELANIS